jgi:hypothetical protein
LPPGCFFGQWGMNHVFQKEEGFYWFLGAYLNLDQRSPVKGRILSIANLYKNCQYLDPLKLQPIAYPTFDDQDNLVEEIVNEGPALFKLINLNSPFLKQLIWMPKDLYENEIKGATADYFQYFLFIKNSGASHPLE